MATTTKAATAVDTSDLLLLLATEGDLQLPDLIARGVPEGVIAVAWARGEIEFGKTKYVTTGNPATAIRSHNGVDLPPPTLIIEGGVEWGGPKQKWHLPYRDIKAKTLPTFQRYQKYQLEVCVSKDKDVWEWLEDGAVVGDRDSRYARREIQRPEAEKLFAHYVRLSEKGSASLTN